MPPKKKATKKGKGLTRGRTKKQQLIDEDTASSVAGETTDDTASEAPTSPGGESVTSGAASAGKNVKELAVESLPPPAPKSNSYSEDEDKDWEQIPDLTTEFGQGEGKITYVTSSQKFREYEFEERKALRNDYFDLEMMRSSFESSLKAMRNLYPEVLNGKVCDAVKAVGCPSTYEDLCGRLFSLPAPSVPVINIHEPLFEESDQEDDDVPGVPYSASTLQTKNFPSPAKMRKFETPKNQNGVYQFGTQGRGLSTNKAPRLPKPGEIVYSEGGSPILQRRIMDNSSQPNERVEILQPDGSKLEVDIVYRGVPDGSKIRNFKEFARDVRGIAASRATSVRQNRIQPPKIVKAGSQSAISKSKKPEWR